MIGKRGLDMYKKILIPIDGSEGSAMAVNHCISLIESIRSEKITLLHVASIPSQLEQYSGKLGAALYKMKSQLQEYGEEILAAAKNKIEQNKPGVNVEAKMAWGDTKYEIVMESENYGYDLLIIGSRGLSGAKSFFMGSVSNYVSQHAKCTVVIVKKEKA